MKTYEGFLEKIFKKKVKLEELKVGDYITYYYTEHDQYPSLVNIGKIIDIKKLTSKGNFHKGKFFYIQTENSIDETTLMYQEIRYLTEDEIEFFNMKLNANKYNL